MYKTYFTSIPNKTLLPILKSSGDQKIQDCFLDNKSRQSGNKGISINLEQFTKEILVFLPAAATLQTVLGTTQGRMCCHLLAQRKTAIKAHAPQKKSVIK